MPGNNINELLPVVKAHRQTKITFEQEARKANVFCHTFASVNVKLSYDLQGLCNSSKVVDLNYDFATMSLVYKYAFALWENIVVYLESCFSKISIILNIVLPDFVRARLLFEIAYHLYISSKTTPYDASGEEKLLEQTVSLLWEGLHSMVEEVRRRAFFKNLREDHRVLLLVHLVFTEIKFSYVIPQMLCIVHSGPVEH